MTESTFKSTDGLNIFTRSWSPMESPRASVIIVPGFNSHSGYYKWAAEQFVGNGIAVYAIDFAAGGNQMGKGSLSTRLMIMSAMLQSS